MGQGRAETASAQRVPRRSESAITGPKLPEHAGPPNSLLVQHRALSQPNVHQDFALYTIGPTVGNRTRKHRTRKIVYRPPSIVGPSSIPTVAIQNTYQTQSGVEYESPSICHTPLRIRTILRADHHRPDSWWMRRRACPCRPDRTRRRIGARPAPRSRGLCVGGSRQW